MELPGKPDTPGFLIEGEFYAFPAQFGMLAPILVEDLTGLKWGQFALLLDEQDEVEEGEWDIKALVGIIGISVWQKHRKWTRQRVVEFMQGVDFENLDFTAPKDDADPPVEADDATSTSGDRSASTQEKSDTNPSSTGLPPSETTAE